MKYLRIVLWCLGIMAGLACLLAGVASTPWAQMWAFNRWREQHPEWQISAEAISAGFSSVQFTGLKLSHGGTQITFPEVDADLSLLAALRDQAARIEKLTAKGWTLDASAAVPSHSLPPRPTDSPPDTPSAATAPSAASADALGALRAALAGWELPPAASCDKAELEGDVLIHLPGQTKPLRIHVAATGNGIAAGKTADFAADMTADVIQSDLPLHSCRAVGQLRVSVTGDRRVGRIDFDGNVMPNRTAWPREYILAARASLLPAGDKSLALELSHDGRRIWMATAIWPASSNRFAGTWKLEVQAADIGRLFPDRDLAGFVASGEGTLQSEDGVRGAAIAGKLRAQADQWHSLGGPIGPNKLVLDANFDGHRTGDAFRCEHLEITAGESAPAITARSVVPFDVNLNTGTVRSSDSAGRWLAAEAHALPIAWLIPPNDNVSIRGNGVSGPFTVNIEKGGYELRSKANLVAPGLSLVRKAVPVAQGLDASFALLVHFPAAEHWDATIGGLTLLHSGRELARIEATLNPLQQQYRQLSITGKLQADLDICRSVPGLSLSALPGRTLTSDFKITVGAAADVSTTISIAGHEPTHTATATVSAAIDDYTSATFRVPIRVTFGQETTDVSVEGTWARAKTGHRVDLQLNSVKASTAHLALIAASAAALDDISFPALANAWNAGATAGGRDAAPFWRDYLGRVQYNFDTVRAGDRECRDIRGTLDIGHDAIRLNAGRAVLVAPMPPKRDPTDRFEPPPTILTTQLTLGFDPKADQPYNLKATSTFDPVGSDRLYGRPSDPPDPAVDGRFTLTQICTAQGANPIELVARREERYEIAGTDGILRLLKTNVADALREPETPVKDAMAGVGSAVGALFGHKNSSLFSKRTDITPVTDAVLDFTRFTGEIGYKSLKADVTRAPDGTLRLSNIAVEAENHRITGTGEIAPGAGSLVSRPMNLELKLAVRGYVAKPAAAAGLLGSEKDPQGFTPLKEPIEVHGTLRQVDLGAWHDLLAKIALPPKKK